MHRMKQSVFDQYWHTERRYFRNAAQIDDKISTCISSYVHKLTWKSHAYAQSRERV